MSTFPPSSSSKLPIFQLNSLPVPKRSKTLSQRLKSLDRQFWIIAPILIHLFAIATLIGACFQHGKENSYLTLTENGGTGRLDYGIFSSCAIASNSTMRICTPYSAPAKFMPSLLLVAPTIPKIALFQLPVKSVQTPSIFLASAAFILLSLPFIIIAWLAVYAGQTRAMKGKFGDFAKSHCRQFYLMGGSLAFISFVLTVTIGIGYRALLSTANDNFTHSSIFNLRSSASITTLPNASGVIFGEDGIYSAGAGVWTARIGGGFGMIWAASASSAMVSIGVNAALHNSLDEIAARDGKSGW